MKINVDTTVCLLHGQCVIAAPEVFSFGDDGALVWLAEVDGALADAATEQNTTEEALCKQMEGLLQQLASQVPA